MADETKMCSNCKREISTSNFDMHEMHCRRHVVLCEHCGEPVHRPELEQHFNDLHAKIPCEKCQRMVSKSDMAKHVADECAKKLMRCEFCELSLPKSEMEAHLDYCGSRTECCPLCKQYIMQKDKLRHESTRCSYPEPKPQPVDPFSMGELQQLMANAVLGNRSSSGAIFRKEKNPTNRKSELNAQRAKNILVPEVQGDSLNSVPADVDYDTMLALQLAHEDWLLDGGIETDSNSLGHVPHYLEESNHGLEDFISFLDDGSEQLSDVVPRYKPEMTAWDSQPVYRDDEDMSIPCEFCEADVPLSTYIVHMDSCPLALERRAADLNNEQVPVQQINGRAAIPVINNLRPSSPEYYTIPGDDDDDVMLPCEFCQETFPSDMIIQHQSLCQIEGVVTPRAATPTKIHRKTQPQQTSNETVCKPSVRSPPKRLKDPALIDFVGQDDSSESVNGDPSNVRFHKINESSSNKYSPAYNRFDDALTRPPRRSARQYSQDSVDSLESKRDSRSIQRTRASLNQLLQEDKSPEDVGSGGTRKKPGVLGDDINKAEPRERKTKVDTRTAMRCLENAKQKPAQGRSGQTSTSQNTVNPSRSDQAYLARSRQRGDHIFSPELRLKPNNSPPPKKR